MTVTEIPSEIVALFNGADLEAKQNVSLIVSTVDEDGWPHLSFLGPGELLVRDAGHLSFMLWPTSRTAGNVDRSGKAVLFFAAGGAVWEVRVSVSPRGEKNGSVAGRCYDARPVAVREHVAPYAEVSGLVRYRLVDPTGVLNRWREQISRLR